MFKVVVLLLLICLDAVSSSLFKRVLEESMIKLLKDEAQKDKAFRQTVVKTLGKNNEALNGILQQDKSFRKTVVKTVIKNNEALNLLLATAFCPPHFTYLHESCYQISENSTDWETAKKMCLAQGSRLVSIESIQEMSILRSFISKSSAKKVPLWTGGNDKDEKGSWLWDGVGTNFGYTNWVKSKTKEIDMLTDAQRGLLMKWLPNKSFHLLYKASRDGMSASAFHQKCDNQGPTISIGLDATTGSVFGGYTSVSWVSNQRFQSDAKAFIFRLCPAGKCTFKRHDVKKGESKAVIGVSSYGPTFGGGRGHDLIFFYTRTYTLDKNNNYFSTNGFCQQNGYNDGALGCGFNIKWRDIEVYAAKDGADGDCMPLMPPRQEWQSSKCSQNARFICEV